MQQQDASALSQSVTGVYEGFAYENLYETHADGTAHYVFESDDLSTSASPDYSGAYGYAADGTGEGGYAQRFEGGSLLEVGDAWTTSEQTQSWTYDDAGTSLDIDQEGTMTYGLDGSGSGSVTFHLEGGGSETCAVSVSAEGSTSLTGCSQAS